MSDPKTVLIVDDSFVSRLWVETFLKQQYSNWNVIIAEGGKDALMKTESVQLDLAILDINMPEMDGFTLGAALKKRFPTAYMTMLTANVKEESQRKAASMGFGLVSKPISNEKMKEILSHIGA
jgi:CheY-like chemotaxis protein